MTLLNSEQKLFLDKALELHKKGKIEEAIDLYSQLVEKNNDNSQILFLIGTAYIQIKKIKEGINYLKKSLALKPDNASAHSNLGNAFKYLKHYDEAISCYNKAIQINPNHADSFSNRGIVFLEMRRLDEALENFNDAIKINPNHLFAHSNKGIALKDLNRYDEAIASYDKAIQINPNFEEPYNNKGNVFKNLKQYDEALKNYEKVMQLNPNYDYILGKILHFKMFLCDWSNLNLLQEKIKEALDKKSKVIEPFSFLGIEDNPSSSKLISEIFVEDKLKKTYEIQSLKKYNHKKPKIGYISGDFRDHPVLHLMMDVFKNHDHSKFDVYAFSFGPDKNDKWRNEVKNHFLQFNDIDKISDKKVINLIQDLEIDILIDLTGFTGNPRSRIFSHRVAPIQINYLGYPGTTGLECMDYIIADDVIIIKDNLKFYTEKVIYLPNCYQANMKRREISNKEFKRSDFGLPENGFVYCSFNNNYKITPNMFDVWMNIIKKVNNSVLWILRSNETAEKNLKKEAKNRGVDPDRIIFASFLPNDEHLKRISLADLFLDTFPYNAHTTASDAVRMGIPIITLVGNSFASRVGSSILSCINMKELITTSKKDYEDIAIKLGLEQKKIIEIKDRLRDSVDKSSLFDSLKFTKNLENLYLELFEQIK